MVDEPSLYLRQADIIDVTKANDITVDVIGAGGIGSFTILALAKMGIKNLTVWDHDEVNLHNLPVQFYPYSCLGKNKAEAIADVVKSFTEFNISFVPRKYVDEELNSNIVISAVDSMKARKTIWDGVKKSPNVHLYIDGRMSSQSMNVVTASLSMDDSTPGGSIDDRIEAYEKTLFEDKDAEQERCTARSIMYTPLAISAIICNQVKRFINNQVIRYWVGADFESDPFLYHTTN